MWKIYFEDSLVPGNEWVWDYVGFRAARPVPGAGGGSAPEEPVAPEDD